MSPYCRLALNRIINSSIWVSHLISFLTPFSIFQSFLIFRVYCSKNSLKLSRTGMQILFYLRLKRQLEAIQTGSLVQKVCKQINRDNREK